MPHPDAPVPVRAWVLIAAYGGVVVGLTGPRVAERPLLARAQDVARWLSGPGAVPWVEPALNVALFLPLGLLLCWGLPRLPRLLVWFLCVLASGAVELTQFLALPGRDGSLLDVAMNSTGAALGVLVHRALAGRPVQPVRQQ